MPDPIVLDMPIAHMSQRPNTLDKFVLANVSFEYVFFRSKKSKLNFILTIIY